MMSLKIVIFFAAFIGIYAENNPCPYWSFGKCQGQENTDDVFNDELKAKLDCETELNVNKTLIEKISKGDFYFVDEAAKDYMFCLFKKMDWFTSEDKISKDSFTSKLRGKELDDVTKAIDNCNGLTQATNKDLSWTIAKCVSEATLPEDKRVEYFCLADSQADPALVKRMHNFDYDFEDEKIKDFCLCWAAEKKWLDSEGKFSKEAALSRQPPIYKTKMAISLDICLPEIPDVTTPETAWRVSKCNSIELKRLLQNA